jgi:hypothetical protein
MQQETVEKNQTTSPKTMVGLKERRPSCSNDISFKKKKRLKKVV